jgi:L-2-hydroxycarboxylate dehydrogenase (NAD+)
MGKPSGRTLQIEFFSGFAWESKETTDSAVESAVPKFNFGGFAMSHFMDWSSLTDFITKAFAGYGVPTEDAAICTDVLLESDKRGIESHGVNRFKPIYIDRIKAGIQFPVTEFEVLRETATTAVIDGHHGMGQVIGFRSMSMAIEKAKKYGMGMVAVRNSTHYGIAGYYATMATKAGCIGITGTNARPSIAPTFGVEPMLGTNPLTFGLPTDEAFPFVLDCATSVNQRGKIEYYARMGKKTPAGQVIGRDGTVMTDSNEILKALTEGQAALAPLGGAGDEMGGYKGYGYAAVVEILSAALQQGQFLHALTGIGEHGEKRPFGLGHFFMAIDPEAFMGRDAFEKSAGDILRALRASEKAPGQEQIYTAGEKEYLVSQKREKGLDINEAVERELTAVRDDLKLDFVLPWD